MWRPTRNTRAEKGSQQVTRSGQVKFGPAHKSSISLDSSEDDSFTLSSENVNERLRHQMPVLEEFTEFKQFNKITTCICTILLQICHQEIQLIRETNHIPIVDVNLEYIPLNEKYTNAEYDLDVILDPSEPYLNYLKFKKDVSWIEQILLLIVVNLKKDFYFDDFVKILKDDEITKQEENTLLASKEFNKRELEKLRLYIEKERREWMKSIRNITEDLAKHVDLLNCEIVESKVKINYVKEWQKARDEQHHAKLQNQENNLLETRNHLNLETEKEERVHEELWLYLENSLQEYKDGIEYWMEKYDADFDEKEKYVEDMKQQVEKQRDDYKKLLEEYNVRVKVMEEYKQHKLMLEQEAEELECQTQAAIKIQAWWRGVMFRKRLGPYRKRKGKKGGSRATSSVKTKKK